MASPTPAGTPAPIRLPFQLFTRWIPEFLGNLAITLGGPKVTMLLDNVGYGDMLILHVKGTYTVATAPLVFIAGAPWSILSNILVQPPGLTPPVNHSGYTQHLWNLAERNFVPFTEGADFAGQGLDANAFDAGLVDVFPTALGAATAHLWYVVPFHRSSMDTRGILPLGNKTRALLTLAINTAANLVSTPANLTVPSFSVDVYQAYLTAAPAGTNADPDPYWSVTYEELSQPIAALGAQTINIEPNDSILGILHEVTLNSAPDSADIANLTLRVNKSYYHNQLGADAWHFIQRRRLGFPMPAGVILYDMDRFADTGAGSSVPGSFPIDAREWIHSQDVQSVQSVLSIPTGTIGALAQIVTGVKRLVDLAPGAH